MHRHHRYGYRRYRQTARGTLAQLATEKAYKRHVAAVASEKQNIRAAMQSYFPQWSQWFWTWLTGKALPGETPSKSTPATYLAATLTCLAVGMFLEGVTLAALMKAPWWETPVLLLLLFYWLLLTSGSMRVMHVVIGHHCVHRSFAEKLSTNQRVAEFISILILMVPWTRYVEDHVGIHHSKKLATLEDGDVKMLLNLGFHPGKTRKQYWRQLAMSIVSPRFHWMFLKARLQWNFLSQETPGWRRMAALGFQGSLLGLAVGVSATTHSLFPLTFYVVGWVMPLVPLFAISALVQWCSEHKWLLVETADETIPYKILLARLTNLRFVAAPLPGSLTQLGLLRGLGCWGSWAGRVIFVDLWVRLYLLCGDLPAHAYHHRYARDRRWPQSLQSCADAVANPKPGEEPWTEVWNLMDAINSVFDTLAVLPSLPHLETRLTTAEKSEVAQGM